MQDSTTNTGTRAR